MWKSVLFLTAVNNHFPSGCLHFFFVGCSVEISRHPRFRKMEKFSFLLVFGFDTCDARCRAMVSPIGLSPLRNTFIKSSLSQNRSRSPMWDDEKWALWPTTTTPIARHPVGKLKQQKVYTDIRTRNLYFDVMEKWTGKKRSKNRIQNEKKIKGKKSDWQNRTGTEHKQQQIKCFNLALSGFFFQLVSLAAREI